MSIWIRMVEACINRRVEGENMSIWNEYLALQKARREKERVVMADYDRDVYYPALKALRERCVAEGGHNWQWTDVGPSGDAWCFCRSCGERSGECLR